jgi:hypothetical protein
VTDTRAIGWQTVEAFAAGDEGAKRFVHLLHEILFAHLSRRGARVDWEHRRAYYVCTRGNARYVEYQARVHKERRRVAWWPGTDRSHCVHKAAFFHFMRFGAAWALCIVPTYVFTTDGAKDRLGRREESALATRYSTEDYNPKVVNDIFFWRSVLAGDEGHIALDAGMGESVALAAEPTGAFVAPVPDVARSSEAAAPEDSDAADDEHLRKAS